MTLQAVPATEEAFQLAEGPVWDGPRRRLLWVDILGGTVHEGRLDGARIEVTATHAFEGTVGAVAVADDGAFLVAGQEELVIVDPDGSHRLGPRIVPAGSGRRTNDGSPDPSGRFVVGTLAFDGSSDDETLVRVEDDGALTVLDDDLRLSNGLAWSADGRRLYSIDTGRGTVFARDYDPVSGAVGERRVHLRIVDGHPDGLAIDAQGQLWIAIYGAGQVRRYAPDGTVMAVVEVPAPHTTCTAFAGDDLRTMVITTAYGELPDGERPRHPCSGQLFTVAVDVPGLPVPAWNGLL